MLKFIQICSSQWLYGERERGGRERERERGGEREAGMD